MTFVSSDLVLQDKAVYFVLTQRQGATLVRAKPHYLLQLVPSQRQGVTLVKLTTHDLLQLVPILRQGVRCDDP